MRTIKRLLKRLISQRLVNILWHLPRAVFWNIVYGFPARRLRVIGVAGTKGKSTTASFISQLLERDGKRTALLSTTTVKVGDDEQLNAWKMTTGDVRSIQQLLRRAANARCPWAVLEVSSHGLDQFRTWGIPFEIVVLTNLMSDHLEYHATTKEYQNIHRAMVSRKTRCAVMNADDPNLDAFADLKTKLMWFGMNARADLRITDSTQRDQTSAVSVRLPDGIKNTFTVSMPGRFNVYNAVAGMATALAAGVAAQTIVPAIPYLKAAPGRLERIENNRAIEIFVDYAHSPDSLENVLSAVKPSVQNRLIIVMGATGERDAAKRPVMGRILAHYADALVVTNDDPYGEDEEKIATALLAGITKLGTFHEEKNLWKILDRRAAIARALAEARTGDTILVLGKGAEQWQVFKDKKIPWDDRTVVREELNRDKG